MSESGQLSSRKTIFVFQENPFLEVASFTCNQVKMFAAYCRIYAKLTPPPVRSSVIFTVQCAEKLYLNLWLGFNSALTLLVCSIYIISVSAALKLRVSVQVRNRPVFTATI